MPRNLGQKGDKLGIALRRNLGILGCVEFGIPVGQQRNFNIQCTGNLKYCEEIRNLR